MSSNQSAPHIGVLAIQGDYESHAQALTEAGAIPSLVKTAADLTGPNAQPLDGLVLPGGESTTMLKFLLPNNGRKGFFDELQAFVQSRPTFGTCAGAILLASEVLNPTQPQKPQRSLAALDITVERNAYGAQADSAILYLETTLSGGPLETVFIRAPRIVRTGPGVKVFASRDGFPILVGKGNIMAATFHPELSQDRRVHQLFVAKVKTFQASHSFHTGDI